MRSSPLFMSPRVSFEIYELSATFSFLFTFLCSSLQLRRRRRFFARHHPPTHSALVHGYFHCGHRSNRAKKMIKGKKKKGEICFPLPVSHSFAPRGIFDIFPRKIVRAKPQDAWWKILNSFMDLLNLWWCNKMAGNLEWKSLV